MNKNQVDAYRGEIQSKLEEVSITSAEQVVSIAHIHETLTDIKDLLKQQNGRVRKNENALSAITAVGSVLSVVFTGFIAWIFKGRM